MNLKAYIKQVLEQTDARVIELEIHLGIDGKVDRHSPNIIRFTLDRKADLLSGPVKVFDLSKEQPHDS